MRATLLPSEGSVNQLQLAVDLAVTAGWHLYGDVPAGSPLKMTSIQLELPEGIEAVGQWERPIALSSPNDPGKKIYSGPATFTFRRNLKISRPAQGQSVQVKVDYQACNEKYCLPPAVLQESIAVPR